MEYKIKNSVIPESITKQWQDIVDAISDLLSVPAAMINRVNPPDLEIFQSSNRPDNPMPSGVRVSLADAYCRNTLEKQKQITFTDARKDPVMAESMAVKDGYYAYMGYPLYWPGGEIFGTICVVDNKVNTWKNQQDKILNAFKDMVETHLALIYSIEQLNEKNIQLEKALNEVKTLKGLLPICATCKKVRDDKGYWKQIESYIREHSEAEFSHSICPECADALYKEVDKIKLY